MANPPIRAERARMIARSLMSTAQDHRTQLPQFKEEKLLPPFMVAATSHALKKNALDGQMVRRYLVNPRTPHDLPVFAVRVSISTMGAYIEDEWRTISKKAHGPGIFDEGWKLAPEIELVEEPEVFADHLSDPEKLLPQLLMMEELTTVLESECSRNWLSKQTQSAPLRSVPKARL